MGHITHMCKFCVASCVNGLRLSLKTSKKPVVGSEDVRTVFKDDLHVDTAQERSSTNCVTPIVTRLDNKSLSCMCIEQTDDQISTAAQFAVDRHRSIQSTTDCSGWNIPFSAETLAARFHLSHSVKHAANRIFYSHTMRSAVAVNCATLAPS